MGRDWTVATHILLFLVMVGPVVFADPPGVRDGARQVVYVTYRYIDKGGISDPATGQSMEAFSLLIPKGWTFEGGIRWLTREKDPRTLDRGDLMAPARTSFQVVSPDKRCALVAYPETFFSDLRSSPAGQMGLFPPGSNYMGTISCPMLDPAHYIAQYVIPTHRRDLQNARLVAAKDLPQLAALSEKEAAVFCQFMGQSGLANVSFKAGLVTVEYSRDGVAYREDFLAILTYLQMQGVSMWWPKSTVSARAPKEEYDSWAPCFLTMLASIRVNPRWFIAYKQMTDETWRGIQDVDAYCRKIDHEIWENKAKTNLQIHRDMYPVLTGYITKQAPDGTRQYLPTDTKHFINDRGEIVAGNQAPEGGGWKPMKDIQPGAE